MKFLAEDDRLIITLEGWEVVWSLRRTLVIPRTAIVSLAWTPEFTYTGERFFRLGGTGAPGMLYAGNFRGGSGWYFLFVRRPKGRNWLTGGSFKAPDILDITTQGYTYGRLLLSCRPDIGVSLMNWFKHARR
jgi:hypothetical protein